MDIYDAWTKALKQTVILRSRVQSLKTFEDTILPYIFLAESTVNEGDTVARTGEVVVERPALILPPHTPQFEGFDFESLNSFDQSSVVNFLLIRGIQIPSMHYNNKTSSLTVVEGNLNRTIPAYLNQMQQKENVAAGLLTGPEDCWQFSVLVYVASQIARNAERDIQKLLEEFRKKRE